MNPFYTFRNVRTVNNELRPKKSKEISASSNWDSCWALRRVAGFPEGSPGWYTPHISSALYNKTPWQELINKWMDKLSKAWSPTYPVLEWSLLEKYCGNQEELKIYDLLIKNLSIFDWNNTIQSLSIPLRISLPGIEFFQENLWGTPDYRIPWNTSQTWMCTQIFWGILLKCTSDSVGLKRGMIFCIFNNFLGDAVVEAAGPWTTLWVARL